MEKSGEYLAMITIGIPGEEIAGIVEKSKLFSPSGTRDYIAEIEIRELERLCSCWRKIQPQGRAESKKVYF